MTHFKRNSLEALLIEITRIPVTPLQKWCVENFYMDKYVEYQDANPRTIEYENIQSYIDRTRESAYKQTKQNLTKLLEVNK